MKTTLKRAAMLKIAPCPKTSFLSIQTCSYSGATLLARLLGSHPQLATVGEMDGPVGLLVSHDYRCSCLQKIIDCPFWRQVQCAMRQSGFDLDLFDFGTKFNGHGHWLQRRLRAAPLASRHLSAMRDAVLSAMPSARGREETLVKRNEALVKSVLSITGKQHFVDSSKDPLRLTCMLELSSFDVRVVHLVRDARGVVASHLRHRRSSASGSSANRKSLLPRVIARFWVAENRRFERALQTLDASRWMRVRYEDLCLDTAGTLSRLHRFLGADPNRQGSFYTGTDHIIGNEMRLNPARDIALDERWRYMLGSAALGEIAAAAGALNRRYGYV